MDFAAVWIVKHHQHHFKRLYSSLPSDHVNLVWICWDWQNVFATIQYFTSMGWSEIHQKNRLVVSYFFSIPRSCCHDQIVNPRKNIWKLELKASFQWINCVPWNIGQSKTSFFLIFFPLSCWVNHWVGTYVGNHAFYQHKRSQTFHFVPGLSRLFDYGNWDVLLVSRLPHLRSLRRVANHRGVEALRLHRLVEVGQHLGHGRRLQREFDREPCGLCGGQPFVVVCRRRPGQWDQRQGAKMVWNGTSWAQKWWSWSGFWMFLGKTNFRSKNKFFLSACFSACKVRKDSM